MTDRYAFIRSERITIAHDEPGRTVLAHAIYDVVDNSSGAPKVLAYAVKYEAAMLITQALNAFTTVATGVSK